MNTTLIALTAAAIAAAPEAAATGEHVLPAIENPGVWGWIAAAWAMTRSLRQSLEHRIANMEKQLASLSTAPDELRGIRADLREHLARLAPTKHEKEITP